MAKAIANGFPLAAVGGSAETMAGVEPDLDLVHAGHRMGLAGRLAATLRVMVDEQVPAHLARVGGTLLDGLHRLAAAHDGVAAGARGVPEMCFLELRSDALSRRFAVAAARRGLLFKRSAYNFVSLAHDGPAVIRTLGILDEVLSTLDGAE